MASLLTLCYGTSLRAQHESAEKTNDSKDSSNRPRVFKTTGQMPVFNGDVRAFLSQAVVYPIEARKSGNAGRSIVAFVINEDGKVSNVRVVRSCGHQELDAEAARVVAAMPDWKPGRQNGKAVKVYLTLPTTFSL